MPSAVPPLGPSVSDALKQNRARTITLWAGGVVLVYAVCLLFVPELFRHRPFATQYFYDNKRLLTHGLLDTLPLAVTLVALFFCALRIETARAGRIVLGLFCCALALQWSLSLLEGRGAERLSSTLIDPQYGHSEFPVLAWEMPHPLAVARNYEQIAATDRRFRYARSKPPGQLLFFALCARTMRALHLERACDALAGTFHFYRRDPVTAFGVFATLLFSIISCLPIFVVARWGRAFALGSAHARASLDSGAAGAATAGPPAKTGGEATFGAYCALVLVLLPSFNLVTMHMDQVLYPLLTILVLWTAVLAIRRNAAYAILSGVISYAAVYVSFSLLFLLPTLAVLWGSFFVWSSVKDRVAIRRSVVRAAVGYAAGLAASWAVFRLALAFAPVPAYQRVLASHLAARGVPGLVGLKGNLGNFVEFSLWTGWAAIVLYATRVVRLLRGWRWGFDPLDGFTLVYPLVIVAMSIFGHTMNEVGRLWIPLAMPLVPGLADELRRVYRGRPLGYVVLSVVAILAIKNFQDFC